jgi:thiol-disulfide isomerase/thioredoxin
MLSALIAIATQGPAPTLDQVYAKVRALPGVHIQGEMVRPAVVRIEFKLAPGGAMWAKYPTSEQFITPSQTITWMPDRRQFSRAKTEQSTPTPVGFEAMWPGATKMTPLGDGKAALFADQEAWEIPCQSAVVPKFSFFVAKKTGLPLGSIATANGATYEIHYRTVKVVPISAQNLRFTPPSDAKPFVASDPTANLPKAGEALPSFRVKDYDGKVASLDALLKGRKGLVLNLWFSACSGCMAELPVLSKLGREYGAKGISFLGVNPIDDARTARRTFKQHAIPFSTLVGKDAKTIAEAVGVVSYPVTIVVNAGGKVVDTLPAFDRVRLEKALESLE